MKNKINDIEAVLRIGKVTSVKGRFVEATVDKLKNASYLLFDGITIKNVSVGGYIKICKGFEELIGKIEGEYITEDNGFDIREYKQESARIKRILNVSLVGYFDSHSFKQGIKELPLIDNECYLLTKDEFDRVHNFIKIINGVPDEKIRIGSLANDASKSIEIGVNSLFASHIGIFGNTGSGKSYTLAGLYHNLFKKYGTKKGFQKNAKFLFIDFNGEYAQKDSIVTEKKIFSLNTRKSLDYIKDEDKLPLDENVLADVEVLSILASATEKTQKPFISRTISFFKTINNSDEPLAYFQNILKKRIKQILQMSDKEKAHSLIDYLCTIIDDGNENIDSRTELFEGIEWNNTNKHFMPRGGPSRALTDEEIENTCLHTYAVDYEFPANILTKIIHFLYLQLTYDVYIDKAKNDHVGPAINKLKSKATDLQKVISFCSDTDNIFKESNIVVVDLNNTNIDIKKTIPLLLAYKIYSNHKIKYRESDSHYLNIIIDEAHNILSYNSQRESETWKDYRLEVFEEIIKEGRKFGVFLTIASQRPSDISSTIISQLHNYFLHRLINNKDIEAVEKTISFLDKVSFDSLPILPTGTCILSGLCAQVPVIIEIDKMEEKYEPLNKTIKPVDFWTDAFEEREIKEEKGYWKKG